MKISIVVPTYNATAWLKECVASVTDQLSSECELILVDDGSTDGTAREIERIANGREQVKAILRPHGGVSAARNAGLEAARGAYVAFLDCDDCLKEGFFAQALRLTESGADLYIAGFERVEKDKVTPILLKNKVYAAPFDFADDYIRIRQLLVYSSCNKLYRRSLIGKHGMRFEEGVSFGEDRLFNYGYLPHCGRIETSELCMFRYMQRKEDSASKKVFPDYEAMILRLHRAKMDCFLGLSKGTTTEERDAFVRDDLAMERKRMKQLGIAMRSTSDRSFS